MVNVLFGPVVGPLAFVAAAAVLWHRSGRAPAVRLVVLALLGRLSVTVAKSIFRRH